jgi:hypothetical protein
MEDPHMHLFVVFEARRKPAGAPTPDRKRKEILFEESRSKKGDAFIESVSFL